MAAPELSAVAVSKYFGGVCAVDKVTFTVRKGDIVSVIGPNGAGKTSLLKAVPPINSSAPSEARLRRFRGTDRCPSRSCRR